ncbi:MAG: hypothetical protein OXG44_10410, partial [Gammaproteobacteria bacterium]|nr:hypothetical protein [Gammaproteobacteria bacterium]
MRFTTATALAAVFLAKQVAAGEQPPPPCILDRPPNDAQQTTEAKRVEALFADPDTGAKAIVETQAKHTKTIHMADSRIKTTYYVQLGRTCVHHAEIKAREVDPTTAEGQDALAYAAGSITDF